MRSTSRALALVACVAVCGCSFAFVHAPPPPPAPQSDCTSSKVVPILDTVAGSIFALFGVYAAAADDAEYRSNFCAQYDGSCSAPPRAVTVVTSLAIAAAWGASAYVGSKRGGECQRVLDATPTPTPTPNPTP